MTGKFQVLYADPPWTFRTRSDRGKGKSPEQHYPCLSLEELAALPLADIAATDSALFCWTTSPHLEESLAVIRRWRFEFKSVAFVWTKSTKADPSRGHFGLGYWTRMGAEFVILATRGRPQRVSRSVRQVIEAPVGEHSRKPEEARERIVQLMGDVPRVELFAREESPGWTALGNGIDGRDIREALVSLRRNQHD